ncbi:S8 family serine peptidase [Bdellovibrio reynosensis]|uniref:S8 family serine peptidase n=1 Tax=Bdellovibrio reynosensis TaxID=2835041 RepID=A0ABY4C7D4_9BACT|nr:S8 family serine peptidase [Bdellovibrio reynosensis]UOF00374.1 S8 family serine peptidase [Bdellovibrio reynosensis]
MVRLIGRAFTAGLVGVIFTAANSFAAAPESVPGEYIVKLKDTVSAQSSVHTLSQALGSYVKSTIPGQNIVVIKRPVFEIQSNVIKTLSENPLVDIVEPNFIYRINKTSNDPLLGNLWGIKNTGQQDSQRREGIAGMDVGAEQAWDITTGNRDIIVAVIDTGIDYNHPDLKENLWINEAEAKGQAGVDDDNNGIVDDIHGANFVDSNKPTGNPLDDHGHGSHCSGTIGATGNDGRGIVGVAWNVRLMGVKFLSASGSGSLEGALKGIDYAVKMGAVILSNSWGGGGYSETLKQAIERSHQANTLFVAAAGNESNNNDANPTYPATYDVANIVSVAAVDNRGQIASFSNYGKTKVHVGAPGVNVYSSIKGGGYDSWSGTSMAAPHVSGMAVLLKSNEPNLSNVEMKERIVTTAKPIAGLRGKSKAGMANAYAMLTNTLPQPDPNDPANWATVAVSVSSAHPYKEKTNETYEVRVPGAQQIALYFSKFDTERDYDKVELYDASGKKLASISGKNDDSFSTPIPGEYVKIVFTSDDSVNRYGFDITKAAWK